jgi:hypothetical protein
MKRPSVDQTLMNFLFFMVIDSSFGQQYLTFSCQFKATMNDGKLFHPVRCLINLFQRLLNRVLGHASITITICVIKVQHRILNLT